MKLHKDIGIGEVYASESPVVISTILGSCVSVCVFSIKGCAGGMTHFALPEKSVTYMSDRREFDYGDRAISELLLRVLSFPFVDKTDLRAKLTGGSDALGIHSVGLMNVAKAREVLACHGIPVISEDVGGVYGRKIYFYCDSGRLRVAKLSSPILG